MRLRIEHEGRRIQITQEILDRLSSLIRGTVSGFAKEKRLPYLLIYNLVHGRVKSVSVRNYRRIFHEEPPDQELERVDGKHFRNLVRLWVFLHGDATEKDLYRELHSGKEYAKTDYRIFSGKTRTVKSGLQKTMERKFLDHGLGKSEIEKWVQELDESHINGKVSYQKAKPALDYLRKVLKVSVTHLLNQSISRYETGELKTISVKKHREILDLKEKAVRALRSGSRFEIEKLREKICGKRRNMVLFSEIEDQLEFLREFPQVKALISGHVHMHYIETQNGVTQVVTGSLPEYPTEIREFKVYDGRIEIATRGLSDGSFAARSLIKGHEWTSGEESDRTGVITL